MKILIVEDDRGLAGGLAFALRRDGYEADCAETLAAARERLQAEPPDAVLLDLNLPDGDGIDFCREIREYSRVPILMLTARDMETDEVQGLLSGADDYLTKPFSLSVLKARLDTVLRRSVKQDRRESGPQPAGSAETADAGGVQMIGKSDGGALTAGELRLLPGRMKVFRGEREIECSATEFRLLYYLMKNRGQVLLKSQILEYVWDSAGSFVDENTLQVTVRRLRRKIERDPSEPACIRTVHGMGYIFAE